MNIPTLSILVLEDDTGVSSLMSKILKREGHRITCAYSASEGLDKVVRSTDFDLIILDMNLPDMDGQQFLDRLNQQQIYIPVVITSGDPSLIAHYTSQTILGLEKPFTIAELLSAVSFYDRFTHSLEAIPTAS